MLLHRSREVGDGHTDARRERDVDEFAADAPTPSHDQ